MSQDHIFEVVHEAGEVLKFSDAIGTLLDEDLDWFSHLIWIDATKLSSIYSNTRFMDDVIFATHKSKWKTSVRLLCIIFMAYSTVRHAPTPKPTPRSLVPLHPIL